MLQRQGGEQVGEFEQPASAEHVEMEWRHVFALQHQPRTLIQPLTRPAPDPDTDDLHIRHLTTRQLPLCFYALQTERVPVEHDLASGVHKSAARTPTRAHAALRRAQAALYLGAAAAVASAVIESFATTTSGNGKFQHAGDYWLTGNGIPYMLALLTLLPALRTLNTAGTGGSAKRESRSRASARSPCWRSSSTA